MIVDVRIPEFKYCPLSRWGAKKNQTIAPGKRRTRSGRGVRLADLLRGFAVGTEKDADRRFTSGVSTRSYLGPNRSLDIDRLESICSATLLTARFNFAAYPEFGCRPASRSPPGICPKCRSASDPYRKPKIDGSRRRFENRVTDRVISRAGKVDTRGLKSSR